MITISNDNNNNNNNVIQAATPKSVFTTTTTRQCPSAAAPMSDTKKMKKDDACTFGLEEVSAYHAANHQKFIQYHETQVQSVSSKDRCIAVKSLIREAARHSLKCFDACTPLPVSSAEYAAGLAYRKQWWTSFISQTDGFLSTPQQSLDPVAPAQRAVENISSLGIWYHHDDDICMPTRKYAMLAYSHMATTTNQDDDDQVTATPVYAPVVVMGVCQFGYSNYVQESRAQAQSTALAQLKQEE